MKGRIFFDGWVSEDNNIVEFEEDNFQVGQVYPIYLKGDLSKNKIYDCLINSSEIIIENKRVTFTIPFLTQLQQTQLEFAFTHGIKMIARISNTGFSNAPQPLNMYES